MNMKKPRVSIVLPVYNGERFLDQAINSVMNQTFTEWELIIVNDCSTDNSASIMRKYADKDSRIIIVDNEANMKLPRSLNIGFGIARGEYYTWTSDDNLLKPNMLMTLVRELDDNPEYGMVYSDHDEITEDGEFINTRFLKEPCYMGIEGNVCGASFLYRSTVAHSVGDYDPALFLAEDYDYWMRVYAVTDIKHITDVLYSTRWHEKSLTATRTNDISRQTLKAVIKNVFILLEKAEGSKGRYDLCKTIYNYAVSAYGRPAVKRFGYQVNGYFLKIWSVDLVERIAGRIRSGKD